jgi:hypothetical protein
MYRTKQDRRILILAALGRNRPEYQRARIDMTLYHLREMDTDNLED